MSQRQALAGNVDTPAFRRAATLTSLFLAGTVIAAAATLAGVGRAATADESLGALLHGVGGFTYLAVGTFAWQRRPQNRTGQLLVLAAFAWFLVDLKHTNSQALFTVGDVLGNLVYGVIAQVAIAFPSGQLQSERERSLVSAVYFWVIVGTFPLIFAPVPTGCHCTQDLLDLRPDVSLYHVANIVQQIFNVAMVAAVAAVVIIHRIRASEAARRAMAPVIWSAGPIVALIVGLNVENALFPGWVRTLLTTLTPVALAVLPIALAIGLVRTRLAQLAVGTLVVELTQNPESRGFRDAIARTLGDNTVDIAYFVGGDEWVDDSGRPVTLPREDRKRAYTLLERNGEKVAAIVHDKSLENDPALVSQVAAASALAIENERLRVELLAKLAEVEESRTRLVEVADVERRKLERDLHDGAQQRLISLALTLGRAQVRLENGDQAGASDEVKSAAATLQAATGELRELASGIRPAVLTDAGLAPALDALAERAPVPVTLRVTLDRRFSDAVESAAYFAVSEAITNVAKHAQATRTDVTATCDSKRLTIVVQDDGNGSADLRKGTGLRGLRDRLAALGGTLRVKGDSGRGTEVTITLPCA
jgi:signal transduction histidine kinase